MGARRVCGVPSCPQFMPCQEHKRPDATARGYGHGHRKLRAEWATRVATGSVACWRCGQPIPAGEPWHLGHLDGTTNYGGPEHVHCNLSAAGRSAHAL
jgi:hypothetical protein